MSPVCASNGHTNSPLDARTGKPLWDFQTGGPIASNPVSFSVDGKQYVAVAANRVLYVFGL